MSSTRHKLGTSVLSNLPTPAELASYMERLFARQYEQAETPQEKLEIAAWIRASRMNGNNGRVKG